MSTDVSTLSSVLSPPAYDYSSSQQPVAQTGKAVTLYFSKAQPLTLDFSKAQSIAQPANNSPVALDFSIAQPINPTNQQRLDRTLYNMTAAMSGQQMATPEDQAQGEAGRRAGTIAGGISILTGAAGGLLTPGVQVAQETSSLLGPEGQPIIKEVLKDAPSLAGKGFQAIKNALPATATPDQVAKVAKILYHTEQVSRALEAPRIWCGENFSANEVQR